MADTNLTLNALEIVVNPKMVIWGTSSSMGRNPELDQTFDCALDLTPNAEEPTPLAIPELTVTLLGTWLSLGIVCSPIEITTTILGDDVVGIVVDNDPVAIDLAFRLFDVTLGSSKRSWIKWSNIGSLDFTIGRDNVAGERPMDWRGWVYAIKKLSGKVVVYGENGVTFLTPVETAWGMATPSHIGLKGQRAICGSDTEHFYVDVDGRLFSVTAARGIELLGYEEYLSALSTSITMSFDEYNNYVYICDGILGYVYSVKDKSLSSGPVNITGIGYQSGTHYVTASSAISVPIFNMCSDIYDFGNRKNKTIFSMEIGTNLSNVLYAALDYRLDKSQAFATTPWATVNPNGIAVVPCFGVEFRLRLKLLSYEKFRLDYIRGNGIIHGYSYLDSFTRS